MAAGASGGDDGEAGQDFTRRADLQPPVPLVAVGYEGRQGCCEIAELVGPVELEQRQRQQGAAYLPLHAHLVLFGAVGRQDLAGVCVARPHVGPVLQPLRVGEVGSQCRGFKTREALGV